MHTPPSAARAPRSRAASRAWGRPRPTRAATSPARLGSYTPQGGPDIRATHAALPGGGPASHYVVAWMTTAAVTLQATDLYPPPPAGARLAVRKHVLAPAGDAQLAGCVDGKAASPGCVDILPAGAKPTIPAVGSSIEDFSLTAVYEQASNGAFFLGELEKFVHVSPQRFERVAVGGKGPCGLAVRVVGAPGERVRLAAVDPKGVVHLATASLPSAGVVDVEM